MHMADALVSPQVGISMIGLSGIMAIHSVKKIKEEEDFEKKIPLMGIMSAFTFAAQMINFTIPLTGSSGHIGGGILLAMILGSPAAFLSIFSVLLIQCLFFSDGGLLALGCNLFNMGVIPCFIIYPYFIKPILKKGINKKNIAVSSVLGCVLSLQLGAFMVVIETYLSKISELPFLNFLMLMQPIHLIIGLVEGIVTMFVVNFIFSQRKEILQNNIFKDNNSINIKKTVIIFSLITVLIAGGVSLFASQNPDGLEWSIQKITGSTEIEKNNGIYNKFNKIAQKVSIMPGYDYKTNKDKAFINSTSFSGIIGIGMVFIFIVIGGSIYKVKKLKNS